MISAPAIALYLGESYASLGVFDLTHQEIFEKSVFLPQVSLKNLLTQTKTALAEKINSDSVVRFYIVTKYLDRLKSFRLGGSVVQVVSEGFENSYSALNTKALSLAAASLVISLSSEKINQASLETELARIKKINPDSNKVVLQLSEKKYSASEIETVRAFFLAADFKIFECLQPENLGAVRKALLNAGTEGTKEEILTEIKEIFGEQTEIRFWCNQEFKTDFENDELFSSSSSFLASMAKKEKLDLLAYFDHESFRMIQTEPAAVWESPWGAIPTPSFDLKELSPHPFSEIRLDQFSLLSLSQQQMQHEPGPVCAGRGIKPLFIDLLADEMLKNHTLKSVFSSLTSEATKQKLENHLSVLEKGQQTFPFKTQREEIKKNVIDQINFEVLSLSQNKKSKCIGPLASLFQKKSAAFNWPQEIIKKALV